VHLTITVSQAILGPRVAPMRKERGLLERPQGGADDAVGRELEDSLAAKLPPVAISLSNRRDTF